MSVRQYPSIVRFLLLLIYNLLTELCMSTDGTFAGLRNGSSNIISFQGIRYADPPTGKLRWKAPVSPPTTQLGTVKVTKVRMLPIIQEPLLNINTAVCQGMYSYQANRCILWLFRRLSLWKCMHRPHHLFLITSDLTVPRILCLTRYTSLQIPGWTINCL